MTVVLLLFSQELNDESVAMTVPAELVNTFCPELLTVSVVIGAEVTTDTCPVTGSVTTVSPNPRSPYLMLSPNRAQGP